MSNDLVPNTENLSKREQIKADRAKLRRKVREESHSRKLERNEQSWSRYKESLQLIKSENLEPALKRDLLSYLEFRDEVEMRFNEMVALKKRFQKKDLGVTESEVALGEQRWKDAKMWFEALQHEIEPPAGSSEVNPDDLDATLAPDLFVRRYIQHMDIEHSELLKGELKKETERQLAIQMQSPEYQSLNVILEKQGFSIENKIMSKRELAEAAVPVMAKIVTEYFFESIQKKADEVMTARLQIDQIAPIFLEMNEKICRDAVASKDVNEQKNIITVYKVIEREGVSDILRGEIRNKITSPDFLDVQGNFSATLQKVENEPKEFLGYRLPVAKNFTGNPRDHRSGCEVRIDNIDPQREGKIKTGQARVYIVFGEKMSSHGAPQRTELSLLNNVHNPKTSWSMVKKIVHWFNTP